MAHHWSTPIIPWPRCCFIQQHVFFRQSNKHWFPFSMRTIPTKMNLLTKPAHSAHLAISCIGTEHVINFFNGWKEQRKNLTMVWPFWRDKVSLPVVVCKFTCILNITVEWWTRDQWHVSINISVPRRLRERALSTISFGIGH